MQSVLVVSQSQINRELLVGLLRANGYEASTASADSEAMEKLSAHRPALVLLDVPEDVKAALSLVRSIRASATLSELPIVLMAGTADREGVMEAGRLRTSGLMLKQQFTTRGLLETAARAVAPRPPTPPPTKEPDQPAAPGVAPDSAAVLRGLEPRITRAELEERLSRCEQLRAMPVAAAQVLKLTGDARVSVDVIARAIAQDHAIALKILKLANSVVYTRGDPVESVQRAVVRIGVERIRQAVMNVAVIEEFSRNERIRCVDMHQFWEHSIATGLIAAELAHLGGDQEPDAAFTMGLLHDVGRVIMAEQLGPLYEEVIETARRAELPLEQVESRMLLMNHADVMERVLSSWRFAKQLAAPIVHHHHSVESLRRHAPAQLRECLRLVLADRLAHALLLGSSGNESVYPIHDVCAALRLNPEMLQALAETARTQTGDMKLTMLSMANSSLWPSRRKLLREKGPAEFRPRFVGLEPELDAYAILLRELSDEESESPTVVVCHIRAAKEKGAILAALAAVDSREDTRRLPLIVLSAGARVVLEGQEHRPTAAMATPLVPVQLLSVAERLAASRASVGEP